MVSQIGGTLGTHLFTGKRSPRGLSVKESLPKQEMRVQSLDWEDLIEKEMATHSSILPGKSHGQNNLLSYSQ